MAWDTTGDVHRYLEAAGDFLRSRPAACTVALTVAETISAVGQDAYGCAAPLFGWWHGAAGRVSGAFVHTPPFPLWLTPAPAESARPLARLVFGRGRALAGINAEPETAEGFAAQWCQQTGATAKVSVRNRLYRLASLVPPRPAPPGRARAARARDRDLLIRWSSEFAQETGGVDRGAAAVDDVLGYGGFTLWEAGGAPVSMAGVTRQVAGMVRVGPVYTPPQRRGHGYGAAVTAAISRGALAAGADEVLLFTDLANPTSNALCQRLGYRPVQDRLELSFRS